MLLHIPLYATVSWILCNFMLFTADPLVGSIATQYLQNREEHDRIARLWTKRYATWACSYLRIKLLLVSCQVTIRCCSHTVCLIYIACIHLWSIYDHRQSDKKKHEWAHKDRLRSAQATWLWCAFMLSM